MFSNKLWIYIYIYDRENTSPLKQLQKYFNSFMVSEHPVANASNDPMAAATNSSLSPAAFHLPA
jgi:hypothetical protein